MGSLLGCPESSRPVPVNTLASSPSPSTTLLVGTTDITLRVIDCRTFQYVNEMKVSIKKYIYIHEYVYQYYMITDIYIKFGILNHLIRFL